MTQTEPAGRVVRVLILVVGGAYALAALVLAAAYVLDMMGGE